MSALAHDLRYALRRLRCSPGFTVTAILGLGLGASTLLFAAVHAVLLRPLPFNDQHELVLLWEQDPANGSQHTEVSLPHFEAWRRQASYFSNLAALGSTDWGDLEVRAEDPFALTQRVVSSSFFDTLGVSAAVGRTIRPSDEVPGAPSVIVLSHASWRCHFGADPAVVGHTLSVVGRNDPLEIVGIMPPNFQFPAGTDAWLPVAPALGEVVTTLDPFQRVGPLRTLDDLVASTRRPWQFNMTLAVWLGSVGTVLDALALFGTVAHGVSQRTREIGVRRALGASGGAVIYLVSRSAMGAACAGAGVGLVGAWVSGQLLRPLLFEVAPSSVTALGGLTVTVLFFCAASTLLAAWRAVRIEPGLALCSG